MSITAAVLIIGDEILSGRTQDSNLNYFARRFNALGIQLAEARVVPDQEPEIVAAVNALRARYTYVFTTGGIGPTHDDITAATMAAAFNVALDLNIEARAMLLGYYKTEDQLTPARLRMAMVPRGATLIKNPLTSAPGFQLDNVFVLAGVPSIAQAMFEEVAPTLKGGPPILSQSIRASIAESRIAEPMAALAARYSDVTIGSYPSFKDGHIQVTLVLRGSDKARLQTATEALLALVRQYDVAAELIPAVG